ncbi:MAG: LuxR C-terminal-related transcriptional regulator [Hyphomicrobium sp.]
MTEDRRPVLAIADKNPVMRAGLADLLSRDGRFEVAGTVATGEAFIALCRSRAIDVGIIGWSLSDLNGAAVLEALKELKIETRVIVYTGEPTVSVLRPAIKAGAWGFTSKTEEPAVLIETAAAVARGRVSFPYIDIASLHVDPLEGLTARERELLAALANGWSNLQIAARIGISRNTVKYHLKNLYDKLGVSNRAMAVALYVSETGRR